MVLSRCLRTHINRCRHGTVKSDRMWTAAVPYHWKEWRRGESYAVERCKGYVAPEPRGPRSFNGGQFRRKNETQLEIRGNWNVGDRITFIRGCLRLCNYTPHQRCLKVSHPAQHTSWLFGRSGHPTGSLVAPPIPPPRDYRRRLGRPSLDVDFVAVCDTILIALERERGSPSPTSLSGSAPTGSDC